MTGNSDELERLRHALENARRQADQDRAAIEALREEVREHRREGQHRVRNILSVVRSIARRTIAQGETAEDYQNRLDSRLASFTRLQGYILRDPAAGVDLGTLIADELLAFGIGLGAQAHIDGVPICLKPKTASVLGLAFHELARMAVEGSAPPSEGETDVRWQVATDGSEVGHLQIEWLGSGRGIDPASLPDAAFGYEVLEQAVVYQLGGDVQFDIVDGGLTCRFRIPIDCLAPTTHSSPANDQAAT